MLCFVIINTCLGPVDFSLCLETLCIHVWTLAGLDFRKTLSNITTGPVVTRNFFDLVPHRTCPLLMLKHAFHAHLYASPLWWPPFDLSCCRHIAARQDHYEVVVWVHFVVIVNPPPVKWGELTSLRGKWEITAETGMGLGSVVRRPCRLFQEQLKLEKCALGVGENVGCRKTFFFYWFVWMSK